MSSRSPRRPPSPALVVAARHGLPGVVDRTTELPAAAWDDVFVAARRDHLSGLLATAVADGVIEVDPDTRLSVDASWHEELVASVLLEALLVRTAALLDAESIPFRLTKGAALAHLDYPAPAVRTFGDVDVIVHPSGLAGALEVLASNGFVRASTPLRGGYDHRFGKGATFRTTAGLEVDLHRRLAIGRFGVTSRTEDLFAGDAAIALGGRRIPVLDPPERLLHACYHAALGGFRYLRAFRDVAQLILVTTADWEHTFAIADGWRSAPVVAAAIREAWETLDLDTSHPAHRAALSTPLQRADRRALAVFAAEAPFRRQALTAIGRLSPLDVPRYLWCLARPPSRHRA